MSQWRATTIKLSTRETPTIAIMTDEGLYPLASATATAEVRIDKTQVPISLHSVTNHDGETTQVLQAVAEYDGQECTVSMVHTAEGLAVMMDTGEVGATDNVK